MNPGKMEESNHIKEFKSVVWYSLDKLRNTVKVEDFHVLLYLLTLHRYKLFNDIDYSKNINWNNYINSNFPEISNVKTSFSLHKIRLVYEPIIKNIDNDDLYDIISHLQFLNPTILEEYFAEVFEELFSHITNFKSRAYGESQLPNEITKFMCALADMPENAKIYNPFAGVASFGLLLNKNSEYLGQEINPVTWAIGSLRLMAHEIIDNSEIIEGDSIIEWNPQNKLYDLIISSPPFGFKLPIPLSGIVGNISTTEHFLIEKGIETLSLKGKLIVCVSQGVLFNSGVIQNFRKYLIENDLIEYVISFPSGMMSNTGIKTAILVINKDKKEKGTLTFVNSETFVDTSNKKVNFLNNTELYSFIKAHKESDFLKIVSNKIISENEYNLSVPRYFRKYYEGNNIALFANIIRGQRDSESKSGKLVRISDLKNDILYYQLLIDEIAEVAFKGPVQIIEESCLLIALRWKTLKPTYFKYEGTPIFLNPDIIAIKLDDTKIDLGYFVGELHANYFNEQLFEIRIGSNIPIIRREDFLNLKILFPRIEEQKAKVKGYIEAIALNKKNELLAFSKIHGLEKELYEQNTYLRHTIAGPISNLRNSIENIKQIIIDEIAPKFTNVMDLKVSENHSIIMSKYFEIVDRDLLKIFDAVKIQLTAESNIQSKQLVRIDIIDFFEKFVMEKSDNKENNYSIEFSYDETEFVDESSEIENKPMILGNTDLLSDLFNNLIENATNHAFKENRNNRIEIYLMKEKSSKLSDSHESAPIVTILFSNTGKPFSKNFAFRDFIRKGGKSGPNAGDGFGGWYINEIIKYHNGDFSIIDETGPEGFPDSDLATSFEIDFPIIETDEEI